MGYHKHINQLELVTCPVPAKSVQSSVCDSEINANESCSDHHSGMVVCFN